MLLLLLPLLFAVLLTIIFLFRFFRFIYLPCASFTVLPTIQVFRKTCGISGFLAPIYWYWIFYSSFFRRDELKLNSVAVLAKRKKNSILFVVFSRIFLSNDFQWKISVHMNYMTSIPMNQYGGISPEYNLHLLVCIPFFSIESNSYGWLTANTWVLFMQQQVEDWKIQRLRGLTPSILCSICVPINSYPSNCSSPCTHITHTQTHVHGICVRMLFFLSFVCISNIVDTQYCTVTILVCISSVYLMCTMMFVVRIGKSRA